MHLFKKQDLDICTTTEGFSPLTLSGVACPRTCLASAALATTLPIESWQKLGHLQSSHWTRAVERKRTGRWIGPGWRWTSFLRGPQRDVESEVKIMQSCDNVLLFLLFATAAETIMFLISKSSFHCSVFCVWCGSASFLLVGSITFISSYKSCRNSKYHISFIMHPSFIRIVTASRPELMSESN